jgi:hypothetical protein
MKGKKNKRAIRIMYQFKSSNEGSFLFQALQKIINKEDIIKDLEKQKGRKNQKINNKN